MQSKFSVAEDFSASIVTPDEGELKCAFTIEAGLPQSMNTKTFDNNSDSIFTVTFVEIPNKSKTPMILEGGFINKRVKSIGNRFLMLQDNGTYKPVIGTVNEIFAGDDVGLIKLIESKQAREMFKWEEIK